MEVTATRKLDKERPMISPSLLELHLPQPILPARRFRRARPAAAGVPADVLIRVARPADAGAVSRLEAMEDRALPGGSRLIAEVDGRAIAAVAVADGTAVADPFERSETAVELLRLRALQIARGRIAVAG
jgi:hypothetical protein